ncbi:hypothetical protein C922_05681 [Plasmodium inui San Antonio 1]|uniref:Uncharacterized protein n=1 Tax=Plasmodium inui San Antonio 1 TaxID=1237626 RepID=W6ZSP3_9APIC|nr:hypothetical protein C922_05681 [Plasmodium inui San Antonio 1]EUD63937.1 hypothetical protein C922_05681 [Plasmodium inui San Antonio 1]
MPQANGPLASRTNKNSEIRSETEEALRVNHQEPETTKNQGNINGLDAQSPDKKLDLTPNPPKKSARSGITKDQPRRTRDPSKEFTDAIRSTPPETTSHFRKVQKSLNFRIRKQRPTCQKRLDPIFKEDSETWTSREI